VAMSSNEEKRHQLVDATMGIYLTKSDLHLSLRRLAYSLQFKNDCRSCDRLKQDCHMLDHTIRQVADD